MHFLRFCICINCIKINLIDEVIQLPRVTECAYGSAYQVYICKCFSNYIYCSDM